MQNYPILNDNTTIDKAISKNKPLHPLFWGLLLAAILYGFNNLLVINTLSVLLGAILFISLIVACLYIVGEILLERFTVHKKNT